MSIKNYASIRNKENPFWIRISAIPSTPYGKSDMLEKLELLNQHNSKAKIWSSLTNWIIKGSRLTYKQQCIIDTAYHQLLKSHGI